MKTLTCTLPMHLIGAVLFRQRSRSFLSYLLICVFCLLYHTSQSQVYFSEEFANNNAGWTLGTEWQIGPAVGYFSNIHDNDPATDHTPNANNGIAGANIGGGIINNIHGMYYLTSPVIDLSVAPGNVSLSFYRWLTGDYPPYLTHIIEAFDGTTWQTIWISPSFLTHTDAAWTPFCYDVTPYKNANFRIRFGHAVTSAGMFPSGGWNLDDIQLLTPMAATTPTATATPASICNGQSSLLSITAGTLNTATNWVWYQDSCAGTALGMGSSLLVSPASTSTYFVRGEGPCGSTGSCTTLTVQVNPLQTWYLDADNDGLGDPMDSVVSCAAPPGYVANNQDICPLADQTALTHFNTSTCHCDPGYYEATLVQYGETIIVSCNSCQPGYYCPDGISAVFAPMGSFVDTPTAISPTLCPPGYYSNIQGATLCAACPVNTHMPDSGATSCTNCDPGEYQPSMASVACLNCPVITFSQTHTDPCGVGIGSIHIQTEMGGTGPYTYSKDNGISYQASNQFNALSAATYSLRIKDVYGCISDPVLVTLYGGTPPSLVCPPSQTRSTTSSCNYQLEDFTSNGSVVTLAVTILSGSSGTSCADGFLGGSPEPQWNVKINGLAYTTYPQAGICFTNPPFTQFNQNYVCANYPDSIQVCFNPFEDDGGGCIVSRSCSVEICQMFAVPTPGASANYTLTIPNNGSNASWGQVSFSISATGSFTNCGGLVNGGCGPVAVTQLPAPGTLLGAGTHTVTLQAVDSANNQVSCSFTVQVNDDEDPVIICPAQNQSYAANAAGCTLLNVPTPPVSDNCNVQSLQAIPSGPYSTGQHTISWIAWDTQGNSDTCQQTFTVLPAVSTGSHTITQCGAYNWNSQTYTATGTYTGTFVNALGCDSVHTLYFNFPQGGLVDVKAWLSGPFDALLGLMHDSLRVKGLIPFTEPYSPPGVYNLNPVMDAGGETVSPLVLADYGPASVVDWVVVEVRQALNPSVIVANRRALIRRDGQVTDTNGISMVSFPNLMPGNYHVSLKHRNHLGVMTANPVFLSACSPTPIDFRTAAPVYVKPGVNTAPRKVVGSARLLWSMDANFNKNVRYNGIQNDKEAVAMAVGLGTLNNTVYGYRREDGNMDGKVRYNGTDNDRIPMLENVGVNTPNTILNQHTPN